MFHGSRFLPVIRHCLIVLGILVLCAIASAKAEESSPTYRSVSVCVADESGERMPGVNVQYVGRVVDGDGTRVSGAAITIGASRHRKIRDYEDSHSFVHATSGEDGRFEIRTATPFVPFVDVKAVGLEDYLEDYEAKNTMKAPGQWTITLHRPKP